MGSTEKGPAKAYTPPKGKPTPTRHDYDVAVQKANRRVAIQWAAIILLGIVILGLVFVLGSGSGGNLSPTGGGIN